MTKVTDLVQKSLANLQSTLENYVRNENVHDEKSLISDIQIVCQQEIANINDWTQTGEMEDLLKAIQKPLSARIEKQVSDVCLTEFKALCSEIINNIPPSEMPKVEGKFLNNETFTEFTEFLTATFAANFLKTLAVEGAERAGLELGGELLGTLIPGVGEIVLFVFAADVIKNVVDQVFFSKEEVLNKVVPELHQRLSTADRVQVLVKKSVDAFNKASQHLLNNTVDEI